MKERKLVRLLIEKNLKIAASESCTGGLFTATLVRVPDVSKVLDGGYITYANSEKIRLCEVREGTIEKHGVVSEEVTGEMAKGVAKTVGANIGVGISGIAGPGGATPTKPVGMVCFGFSLNGKVKTYTKFFKGKRNHVRRKSVEFAINTLIDLIK